MKDTTKDWIKIIFIIGILLLGFGVAIFELVLRLMAMWKYVTS